MDARTRTSVVGDAIVIALDGTLDLAALPALHDALRRVVIDHPGRTLVADLDGALAIDDAVLGLLLGLAADALAKGGDLRLVCSRAPVLARLLDRRIDRVVPVAASVTAATAAASVDAAATESFYDQRHG